MTKVWNENNNKKISDILNKHDLELLNSIEITEKTIQLIYILILEFIFPKIELNIMWVI